MADGHKCRLGWEAKPRYKLALGADVVNGVTTATTCHGTSGKSSHLPWGETLSLDIINTIFRFAPHCTAIGGTKGPVIGSLYSIFLGILVVILDNHKTMSATAETIEKKT